jgi:predicted neuraminidase
MKRESRQRLFLAGVLLLSWGLAIRESASRRSPDLLISERPVSMPSALSDTPASMSRISTGSPAPSVHSATAVELPDGTIRAFWFGGSREGASDVAIWSADRTGGTWSAPRVAVDRDLVARGTRRYVRKLGNPVAYVSPHGALHLFVVSVSFGGWSGSAVNHLAYGPGDSVVSVNRLIASPVLNLGTLVRGAALPDPRGGILLPAYHETVKKFPLLLRIEKGRVVGREGPVVRGDLFQPAVVAGAGSAMELFLRSGEGAEAKIHYSHHDGTAGSDWSGPKPISIPNPNAGISALRLPGGDFLLAANPDSDSRENLVLFRAPAAEGPWRRVFTVDTAAREPDETDLPRVEYSYPWLMLDRSGTGHLFYTWNRREIRHWCFGQDAINGKEGGAP